MCTHLPQAGCSHVFCLQVWSLSLTPLWILMIDYLQCLRDWRDPTGKSEDIVESGNTKSCPFCRCPSLFVTPSSHFYASGNPRKEEAVDLYKASMARVPCRCAAVTSAAGDMLNYFSDTFRSRGRTGNSVPTAVIAFTSIAMRMGRTTCSRTAPVSTCLSVSFLDPLYFLA